MSEVINEFLASISIGSLFNSISPIVPFIVIIFALAFGLNIFRENISMRYWFDEMERQQYYDNLDDEEFEKSFRNHHN